MRYFQMITIWGKVMRTKLMLCLAPTFLLLVMVFLVTHVSEKQSTFIEETAQFLSSESKGDLWVMDPRVDAHNTDYLLSNKMLARIALLPGISAKESMLFSVTDAGELSFNRNSHKTNILSIKVAEKSDIKLVARQLKRLTSYEVMRTNEFESKVYQYKLSVHPSLQKIARSARLQLFSLILLLLGAWVALFSVFQRETQLFRSYGVANWFILLMQSLIPLGVFLITMPFLLGLSLYLDISMHLGLQYMLATCVVAGGISSAFLERSNSTVSL